MPEDFLSDGPYTYNDPRLFYNEHCFFFDGGYDDICLNPPEPILIHRKRNGGAISLNRNSLNKKKENNDVHFLNLFLKVNLLKINDEPYITINQDVSDKWIRFSGANVPLAIVVNGIAVGMNKVYAEGYLVEVSKPPDSDIDIYNTTVNIYNQGEEHVTIKAVMQEKPQENIDLVSIESYSNIDVSCELISIDRADVTAIFKRNDHE